MNIFKNFLKINLFLFFLFLSFYSFSAEINNIDENKDDNNEGFFNFAENADNLFKNWSLTLGGGFIYQPKYEGSRKMRFIYIPIVRPVYHKFLYISFLGAGAYFPVYKDKIIGNISLSYDFFNLSGERKKEINGIDDKEKGIITSIALMFNFNDYLNASLTARKVFGGSGGFLLIPKAGVKFKLTDKLIFSLNGSFDFGDSKYMMYKFGVTEEQSFLSGYPCYKPSAAIKSISSEISVKWEITKNLGITLSRTDGLLLGGALNSPATFRQHLERIMLMLSYTF